MGVILNFLFMVVKLYCVIYYNTYTYTLGMNQNNTKRRFRAHIDAFVRMGEFYKGRKAVKSRIDDI